jgi:hypothetical protein
LTLDLTEVLLGLLNVVQVIALGWLARDRQIARAARRGGRRRDDHEPDALEGIDPATDGGE